MTAPRRPLLIVTRPAHDAQNWVAGLAQRGCPAQALPLIEIETLAHAPRLQQAWADLGGYHAAMFVSANAVAAFFAAARQGLASHSAANQLQQARLPTGLRCWATGPGTTRALLHAQVALAQIDAPDSQAGQFDSEALWQRVRPQVQPGARVLVVRGTTLPAFPPLSHAPEHGAGVADAGHRTDPQAGHALGSGVGRDWLTQRLQAAGAEVDTVVSYARRCPLWTPAQRLLVQALPQDAVWLWSSSEALANLHTLLPAQDWRSHRALATHARIAQAAKQLGCGDVRLIQPSLDAVAQSIKSWA